MKYIRYQDGKGIAVMNLSNVDLISISGDDPESLGLNLRMICMRSISKIKTMQNII